MVSERHETCIRNCLISLFNLFRSKRGYMEDGPWNWYFSADTKEEKYVVSAVTTVLSDICGPGE